MTGCKLVIHDDEAHSKFLDACANVIVLSAYSIKGKINGRLLGQVFYCFWGMNVVCSFEVMISGKRVRKYMLLEGNRFFTNADKDEKFLIEAASKLVDIREDEVRRNGI